MAEFLFWRRWLLLVGLAITVFGVMMALFSGTQSFDLFSQPINPAFWNVNGPGENAKLFQQWVYGVWGATIAGWGILIVFIARYPLARKEVWAWNCLAAGILIWFGLDTSLSVFYKVYFNAAINAVLLILTMAPLALTHKYFVP